MKSRRQWSWAPHSDSPITPLVHSQFSGHVPGVQSAAQLVGHALTLRPVQFKAVGGAVGASVVGAPVGAVGVPVGAAVGVGVGPAAVGASVGAVGVPVGAGVGAVEGRTLG